MRAVPATLLRAVVLFAFIALAALSASAQDTTHLAAPALSKSSYGLTLGLTRDLFRSNFQYLPGVLACSPPTTTGTGFNRSASIYYMYRPQDRTAFSLSAGYASVSGTMSTSEATFINVDGASTPSTIEHTIEVTLNRVVFGPSIGYEVLPAFSLTLGGEIGILLNPTYTYLERLASPSAGVFIDTKSRIRNQHSGDLPLANKTQSATLMGLRYELGMNALGTLHLVPAVTYRLASTNIVQGLPWKENGIGGSISLEYRPMVAPDLPLISPPVVVSVPRRDTLPVVKPVPMLSASITAMMLDSSGHQSHARELRVEEVFERTLTPVIPYIFFSEHSAELPARYNSLTPSETKSFSEAKLSAKDRLTLYREILNSTGRRLRDNPSAHVTLTGCGDPDMPIKASLELARRRADAVKQYLVEHWLIASSRIAIRTRHAPEHPSPVADPDGIEEDRRVELSSSDPAILSPIFSSDTVRVATTPSIRFLPRADAEAGLKHWTVRVSEGDTELQSFSGSGSLPPSIEWKPDAAQTPHAGVMNYSLLVTDNADQSREASGTMPIQQVTFRSERLERDSTASHAEIERFTLLLFDFNSSSIQSSSNAAMLAEIKRHIVPGTSVIIRGYGDRIGDIETNRHIADERATNAASALGLSKSVIIPSDGRQQLYSNDLPEGRFYSRTVEITVRKD